MDFRFVNDTARSRVVTNYNTLVANMRSRGLVARPRRRVSVSQGGATVEITPVVNLSQTDTPYHSQEGAISITSDGGVIGCIIDVDERTTITSAVFLHVIEGSVQEGPSLNASDLRSDIEYLGPGFVDPSPEPPIDPSSLAIWAHRALSSDTEARRVHPGLDYVALFSDDNDAFLAGIAHQAYANTGSVRADLESAGCSTSTSTSCTGCSSSSTSSAAAANSSVLFSPYLANLNQTHALTLKTLLALN